MKMRQIMITKEEYNRLKSKEKIADDALIQLNLSLDDIKHGRITKFNLKPSKITK